MDEAEKRSEELYDLRIEVDRLTEERDQARATAVGLQLKLDEALTTLRTAKSAFTRAGAKEEREACAKVCEDLADKLDRRSHSARQCAERIRARGESSDG